MRITTTLYPMIQQRPVCSTMILKLLKKFSQVKKVKLVKTCLLRNLSTHIHQASLVLMEMVMVILISKICEQLLKQYYELEEQKQRVAQQLYQANYWNYQTPVQSSTCQQVSVENTSACGLNNPCSLCSCQCISVPLIPTSACAIGGMPGVCYSCPSLMAYCSGSQSHEVPCSSHVPVDNDTAVKAGTLAAEKAINSMKLEIGAAYNACGEKEKGEKSSGTLEGNLSQAVSSGSDFTAVLNAWYLAGLHTGRQDFIYSITLVSDRAVQEKWSTITSVLTQRLVRK
ncbi:uncharacterized protein M6B38_280580 [Iris pallida]|uniref:Uncharacterized protein n=1 Tax=Iris pallida TaxID=29817 RepID=A0AAX6I1P8_IRIPA|nr:uncharacterized protein M6B38_280580 [Iris pallida]